MRQTLTSEHGFETPQIITDAGLIKEYQGIMEKMSDVYDTIRKEDPHVAQLVVPFANKCRRLLSWSQGQDAYYSELRSRGAGHDSYREIAFAVADNMAKKSPLVANNLRIERESYPQHLVKGSRKWYNANKR